ncbi:MAG TPA: hypothetical protein VFA98_01795 [Thermoanaerobaculia bacterium]|jgi:hypothetical protein|nr:hypothetical protein [Thermoanaerobaculia bacterium]
MNIEVETFLRDRLEHSGDTFKAAARTLLAEFESLAGRRPDEREKQVIFFWLVGEWISVAAFAGARAGASFASVSEHLRSEFERGSRKPAADDAAQAVAQEE